MGAKTLDNKIVLRQIITDIIELGNRTQKKFNLTIDETRRIMLVSLYATLWEHPLYFNLTSEEKLRFIINEFKAIYKNEVEQNENI